MSTDPRTVYLKAKAETCELLGFDPDHLSVAEATKVGVVVSLKLALDDLQAKLLTGQPIDSAKLLAASEALARFPPPRARAVAARWP